MTSILLAFLSYLSMVDMFLLQYFYREYYLKTTDRLEAFDQVFGESLKNEEVKLDRVYTNIN